MACALRTLLNAVSPRPGAMPPPPAGMGRSSFHTCPANVSANEVFSYHLEFLFCA